MLTADELLAGAELTYEVSLPADLAPGRHGGGEGAANGGGGGAVRLRPLTVNDLQIISRAAREGDALTATLMVQRSLVEPEMTIGQVGSMPVGLLHFLLGRVNEISGLHASAEEIASAGREPIARAAHVLAREFGWTPDEVNQLTLGQMLLHLDMVAERG